MSIFGHIILSFEENFIQNNRYMNHTKIVMKYRMLEIQLKEHEFRKKNILKQSFGL